MPEEDPPQSTGSDIAYDKPREGRGFSSGGERSEIEYDFRGRRPNEQVMLVARYHAWLLMPIVWLWLILLAILTVLIIYFGLSRVTSIAIFVAAIVGGGYSLYQWFLWNASNTIITNQRVVRIEQQSLFNRQIAEAEIDRIQEISTSIKGPIRTMLNFGTVRIQTASSEGKVDLVDVTSPYDIQQAIVNVQRQVTDRPTQVRRTLG